MKQVRDLVGGLVQHPRTNIASYAPAGPAAAVRGNSSDQLQLGRGGQEALIAVVCNQYLQLASSPAGHKGPAIKHHTVPRCALSPAPSFHACLAVAMPASLGWTQRQPGQENHLLVKSGKMPGAGGVGPCRSRGKCPKFARGHWVSAPSLWSLHLRVPLCLMLARGNAKLLLTLNKLISGLNSLLGAGNRRAGPSCQFQISDCPAKLTAANDPESNTLCPARQPAATGHQNVQI